MSRHAGILSLLVLLVGAGAGAGPTARPETDICSSHVRALARHIRELRPPDPDPRADFSAESAIGTVCDERLDLPVQILPGGGTPPLQWDEGPRSAPEQESADRGDLAEPCSTTVYRRFFADGDSFSFTLGRVEETCNEVPRLLISTRGARQESVPVWPLYDRNVECVWCTPRYLVFGLAAQGEGGPELDRIACWRVGTNEWYWTPEREGWRHRPGFDLAALLPDWRTARVCEAGEALLARGRERALTLWPNAKAWSISDAATGTPIARVRHAVHRQIVPAEEIKLPPRLAAQIQAKFRERDPEFGPFEALEMVSEPCRARRDSRGLIARAMVQGAAQRGPLGDRTGGVLRGWDQEMFGVFLVDSTLTQLQATLGMFPTGRWGDYAAYFDPEAPDDSIVVWGEGESFGDESRQVSYPCPP